MQNLCVYKFLLIKKASFEYFALQIYVFLLIIYHKACLQIKKAAVTATE